MDYILCYIHIIGDRENTCCIVDRRTDCCGSVFKQRLPQGSSLFFVHKMNLTV